AVGVRVAARALHLLAAAAGHALLAGHALAGLRAGVVASARRRVARVGRTDDRRPGPAAPGAVARARAHDGVAVARARAAQRAGGVAAAGARAVARAIPPARRRGRLGAHGGVMRRRAGGDEGAGAGGAGRRARLAQLGAGGLAADAVDAEVARAL